MNIRIQFLGLVGSGKSHVARQFAIKRHGYVLSFAQDVYRLAELVKGAPIDKRLPSDRHLLKLIGTTWGRECKQLPPEFEEKLRARRPSEWGTADIWANLFIRNLAALPPDAAVFNDDTRFANELAIAGRVGFIPVFVKCREETRLKRLGFRGDHDDPNDPEHKSEELINLLNRYVLDRPLLPVVWNDDTATQPGRAWVHSLREFDDIITHAASNEDIATPLCWSPDAHRRLLEFASDSTTVADAGAYRGRTAGGWR